MHCIVSYRILIPTHILLDKIIQSYSLGVVVANVVVGSTVVVG